MNTCLDTIAKKCVLIMNTAGCNCYYFGTVYPEENVIAIIITSCSYILHTTANLIVSLCKKAAEYQCICNIGDHNNDQHEYHHCISVGSSFLLLEL